MQYLGDGEAYKGNAAKKLAPMDFGDLEKGQTEGVEITELSDTVVIDGLRTENRKKMTELAHIYDVNSYEDLPTKDKLKFFNSALKVVKGLFEKIYPVLEAENKAFGGSYNQNELFEMVYARIRNYVAKMDTRTLLEQTEVSSDSDDAKYFLSRRLNFLKDFILSKDFAFYKIRFQQFLHDKEGSSSR